ncbi:MAG TPA: sugar ABC transporter substrate-binding protein [Acidimicrobiia bacterium]|nr:sugar ABC transporter substrate-binding protein [Acidimicrobiia bacterium]
MKRWNSVAVVVALMMVIAACGGETGSETTTTTGDTVGTEAPTTTSGDTAEEPSGDRTQIRWFVGIGAGGQPEQADAQRVVVDEFNASQDAIELILEIVENDVAYETLATQIASNNPPDIIGPVGRDGSNAFSGLYLDLEPLVASTGFDTSIWPEATVENFRETDGTLPGLPFASFPSFIYYNRDLFDEAGLPYPPQEYGADGTSVYGEATEYEGPWDFNKLDEIAQILAVDANGNDGTSADFDGDNVVQWGFVWQWTDRLFQQGAFWGAGYPLADDGTADIPQPWEDEWKWYHEAVWAKGYAPSQAEIDALGGNAFQSGRVAMAGTHLWYTCCVRDDGNNIPGDFFDLAVMPANNGAVTTLMHADTFRILASTQYPDEAFAVLAHLLTDAALPLLTAYGAAPADESLTDAFVASLEERYPQGVNWQVALDSAAFAESPSHEQFVPGWEEYKEATETLKSAILTDPDLDLDAGIADLEEQLTAIFQENAG